MNILYITTHLNRGGIVSYLLSLAVQLKKRGHEIVVASSGGECEELLSKNSIRHIRIPISTKNNISPKVFISYFILKRFIHGSNQKIDVIHAHTRVTQVLSFLLSRRLNIPLITTCHGFFRPRWHRRIFPCWGDKVIAISSQVRTHLMADFNVEEKMIALIHTGVDLQKFKVRTPEEVKTLKREIGIGQNSLVIGSAARFSDVKGLEYFIRAALHVRKEKEDIRFLLVGYGKDEDRLRHIAKDLNIEDTVIFYKPVREIQEYLCVMNIFVMPSIQEGLGLSILEAQAQKIPVIASRVGGIRDIIDDNITGILVSPRDELAISRAILHLLRSEGQYKEFQQNAYEKLTREFSLYKMINETEKIYEDLICR
ncbi:glycosyltransferase family 4 protein [Thermoproteota archaeon]